MDNFGRLPWFVLQNILSALPDLPSLHSLHNAAPEVAAFLHHNNGLFEQIVDAIIENTARERGLLPTVQCSVRQLVIRWTEQSRRKQSDRDEGQEADPNVLNTLRYLAEYDPDIQTPHTTDYITVNPTGCSVSAACATGPAALPRACIIPRDGRGISPAENRALAEESRVRQYIWAKEEMHITDPWSSYGALCLWQARVSDVSPLRCVEYKAFRPYGLIFRSGIRMDALGFWQTFDAGHRMWFALSFALAEKDWDELVIRQLDRSCDPRVL
ncbi:hypothetical protein BDV26DRAFT_295968 [Aspergillus bertholletiae]|uniref:Uncharacterized protein n=1 Tax=Aspergillus bertholletiae TaxID=1226010 RepID=A0A5N7AYP0_9EURO|nr:hypothetical protein BDV26DRAFT_295968 [Aspergillus bertholletiae]